MSGDIAEAALPDKRVLGAMGEMTAGVTGAAESGERDVLGAAQGPELRKYAPDGGRIPAISRPFVPSQSVLPDWGPQPATGTWDEVYQPSDGAMLPRAVRLLIVDDCTLRRDYLVGALVAHGASVPDVAWDLCSLTAGFETTPHVILLNMATQQSAALLRHALKLSASVRVVAMGIPEDDESAIIACAEAGVTGYHLRNESLRELLALIPKVAAGEALCSSRVSAILIRRLSALAAQRQPVGDELVLTAREIQILRMLELGMANQAIADQLCIAVHTVKNHVHSLLAKLGVSTRAQAAALARTILRAEDDPTR